MSDDPGPFMPDELLRWAEMYGHPEEWAKHAQAAHGRAERAEAVRDRLREALEQIRDNPTAYPRELREVAAEALAAHWGYP